jgi:hypothetical protein
MATVTPNYSWPVPTSTDLVKDGATAIEALGDAIDATVFALPSAGLTLINTTSFSGVASQSSDDVFSSTYDNYRIVLKYTQSTSNTTTMRFRTSGSSNTNATYSNAVYRYQSDNTVGGQAGDESQTVLTINGAAIANFVNTYSIDVFSPNLAEYTNINMVGYLGQSASRVRAIFGSGHFANTTLFDGFQIISTTGNITGTYSVYGYNK